MSIILVVILTNVVTIESLGHFVPASPEIRTWTDRSNTYTCRAKLVSYHIHSRVVALRTPDKKYFKVYLVTLSEEDKIYLEGLLEGNVLVGKLKASSYGFPCGPFNKDTEDSAYHSSTSPFKGFIRGNVVDLGEIK